jgi:sugar lactone lactonase YvrE
MGVLEHLEERSLLAALPIVSPADALGYAVPTDVPYTLGNGTTPLYTAAPTGYTPTQIRTAYGVNNVSFAGAAANGTGTTIAIVDAYDDPNIANDLHQFDLQFGLPDPVFTKVNQTGGTTYPVADAGWITEIALDVEWSHAVAPGANILLVEANSNSDGDLYAAVDYARHAPGVVAVSMSWGGGETSNEASTYDSYFATPSGHAGVTFLASSGDGGAPPCYPSISPNVVSVGGTTLANLNSAGNYSSASESGWSGSGGGISAYETQPAYQKGVVTQSTTMRTDPDISYDADPATGFPVYDSFNNGTVLPWGQWGGTSDAAPQWAALVAIADQGRALAGLGSLDGPTQTLPALYAAPAGDFHDITSGSSFGTPSYSAGPGYDLVTGRGTPCANLLINYLVSPNGFTSTTLGSSAGSISYGQPVTLTATVSIVAPGTGTPSGGTVTFMDGGTAIGSAALSGGTATFTTSTLVYGVHELTASYSGSGTIFWPSSTPAAGLTSVSVISTVGGEGVVDGVQPTATNLNDPYSTALDSSGDLFIADTLDNRVREVNHATGLISTVAGTGTAGFSGDNGLATAAQLNEPYAVALDSSGNLYIADYDNDRIRKVNLSTGVITTFAGTGTFGYSGDNGPATAAELDYPRGVAVDSGGDLFIADYYNYRVREVNHATGNITTVAGTGAYGFSGDNGPATVAMLNDPAGVAVDSAGNLYIADYANSRIRKVTASTGYITTVAGTGTFGYNGDNGFATAAYLDDPTGVAVDSSGNFFIADYYNERVREVNASTGLITTVAGSGGTPSFSGDGGLATAAKLYYPSGVALDSSGNLYIADSDNNRIRVVNHGTGMISTFAGGYLGDGAAATTAALDAPYGAAVDAYGNIFVADTSDNRVREINHATGLITTVAGTGATGYNGDNGFATAATLYNPRGVALDSSGNLYIADSSNDRIRKVNLATGTIATVAGNGLAGYSGDGGLATAAELSNPYAIALDSSGDLFIADYSNQRIREVKLSTGIISTVAGGGIVDGGLATAAPVDEPGNVVVDAVGDVFIADTYNQRIREVNHATGLITTVAGTGTIGYYGDNGFATAAEFDDPYSIALDSAGNLYIADYYNSRIRKVNLSTGIITTVAGTGVAGYSGDNGLATAAELYNPEGVALDGKGDLFIADSNNNRVREVKLSTGYITTVAGTGTASYNGDNIQATAATLNHPEGVATDSTGNLYIADYSNNRIREVNTVSGQITTVAGNGTAGYSGDNGAATAAEIDEPTNVAVDSAGDLYIADYGNNRIREVNHAAGTITTIVGDGYYGFSGDGGAATNAALDYPRGVALDSSGNLYIADFYNNRIREVNCSTGVITTIAGNGSARYGGDGGAATNAELYYPTGVAVNAAGNLFIADSNNYRVRQVSLSNGLISTVAGDGSNGVGGDGGAATAAMLATPQGVAVDAAGNLYIADSSNNRIRMVTASTGIISTIAGGSSSGFAGDGGPASGSLLKTPDGVTIDATGNLYIVDTGNNRIREVVAGGLPLSVNPAVATSTSITFAAPGTANYGGSVALSATLLAGGVAVSGETVFFSFHGSPLACSVTNAAGVASVSAASLAGVVPGTYSGSLGASFAGNSLFGLSSASATLKIIPAPLTVAVNNAGKVYGTSDPTFSASYTGFASGEGPANLGGTLAFSTNEPTGGYAPAGSYTISPSGLTSGNYAITFAPGTLTVTPAATSATLGASTVSSVYGQSVTLTATVIAAAPCAVAPTGGTVTFMDDGQFLGTATLSGGTATLATTAIAAGAHGLSAIYNGDGLDFSASSATGSLLGANITTFAGGASLGYGGDGGPATAAMLGLPYAVAVDAAGDLFIADSNNNRVREVNSSGLITTVAGDGVSGYSGDGAAATAAELADPCGLFVDAYGDLFIADTGNNRVREVNHSTGLITTVAGGGSTLGDGGAATAASLAAPYGVAVDGSGDLFIGDTGDNRIREVNLSSGLISTAAGNGTAGYAGDGGAATAAELANPQGIALDTHGNLFIADTGNNRIRQLDLSTGAISTVAGNGVAGYVGDGGPAVAAEISSPRNVAVDSVGDLFIGDTGNCVIREVNLASGQINTIAGNGTADFAGDGGPATAAEVNNPCGIAVDASGRLFIADMYDNRIRLVTPTSPLLPIGVAPAPLTITANSPNKVYGAVLPALTASYAGLVNGDTPASLTTVPSLATTASASSHVAGSPYAITIGGAADPNYTISYVPGALGITPAPLTITAVGQTKLYGAALPTLTASYAGFVNGDTAASLTAAPGLTATASAASHVAGNPYAINASGAVDADYNISYVSGTLTVNPTPLTITAVNQTKPYGAALPTLTASYAGFVNGDTAASLTTAPGLATTASAASHVAGNPYAISVGGAVDADYNITYVPGTLSVIPVPLTITADNKTKLYGAALPAFTASYSGLVGGDTAGSLSAAPGLSTTATPASNVAGSPYAVNVSGAVDADYTFTYVPGTLTVNPEPLTITAVGGNKVYGGSDPAFSASYWGFVPGEGPANLGGALAFTTNEPTGGNAPVGSYQVTPAGLTSANYAITFVAGTLAVQPAPLIVMANGASKTYGSADPVFSATYAGFASGDNAGNLGGALRFTTNEPASGYAAVGSYQLTPAGLTAGNYAITFASGTLTVTPAPLTVIANGASKTYGSADPKFTVTCAGFAAGENAANLGGAPAFTTTEPAAGNALIGSYIITPSGYTSGNYAITFVSGMLSVLPDSTTPGAFNPAISAFYLKDSCCPGAADATVPYGPPGSNWEPIVGDWTGDGLSTLGLYNPATGTFFLKYTNSGGAADLTFNYGPADPGYNGTTNVGWTPLAGDWNGDGTTTVGLYNPATGIFYLKNSNSSGPADFTFKYGPGGPGWTPLAGDWLGNGTTTVGLYNSASGLFFLKDSNSGGSADTTFNYGPGGPGWTPLAGVWNGSSTTVGLYVPASGTFFLKDSNSAGPADMTFSYGPGGLGWMPLVGSWVCPSGESPQAVRATAVSPVLVNPSVTPLTAAVLAPVVQQAIAGWAAAGAPSSALAQMADAQVVVGNLPGGELVQQSAAGFVIDRTAAGQGWFVDPAPGDDQELAADASAASPRALDPRAVDQVDLLTVVEQELGYVAGLKDSGPIDG